MALHENLTDLAGTLRYGIGGTEKKERDAAKGNLPGAPKDRTAEQKKANRYSAGYHFGKTWPRLSKLAMPLLGRLKTSDLPLLGGEKAEDQAEAEAGANRGRTEALNEERKKKTPKKTLGRYGE